MHGAPDLSLIIAVYKNVVALEWIFKGLARQSFVNFEVIIAEDDNSTAVAECVEKARSQYRFRIQHVSQADEGFRKCRILNQAIRVAAADYIVFLDGDCLPHRHFLKAHFENRAAKMALWGRRVMLSEKLSKKISASSPKNAASTEGGYAHLHLLNLIWQGCKRLDAALYLPFLPSPTGTLPAIWGCNWSIHKKDLEAVNGFDEDYEQAGIGEDTDIEWRLLAQGVVLKKIKNKAIQYHLYHKEHYTDTTAMEAILQKKKSDKIVFIKNGLIKREK